jgi:hypothetical protein
MALPLRTPPVEPVRCRNCRRVCRHGTVDGLGPGCARNAGLTSPRLPVVRSEAADQQDLLDLINEGETVTTIDPNQILDLEIGANDSGASTVRGYLTELLKTLWVEGEGFSSKRPFGNSSWEYDLYVPLIKAGIVPGSLDEDGYVEDVDRSAADRVVLAAIGALGVSA